MVEEVENVAVVGAPPPAVVGSTVEGADVEGEIGLAKGMKDKEVRIDAKVNIERDALASHNSLLPVMLPTNHTSPTSSLPSTSSFLPLIAPLGDPYSSPIPLSISVLLTLRLRNTNS